jgi:hypothetical protein
LLHASGYRPEKNLAHYRTLQALPLILGERHKDDANYLDTCRTKRNTAEYDRAGVTTEEDAGELIDFVRELRGEVIAIGCARIIPSSSVEVRLRRRESLKR